MKSIDEGTRSGPDEEKYPSFYADPLNAYELAHQQGVSPVTDTDTLFASFWSEQDSVEVFASTIRRWRSEDS